jgi:predicted  nucleic acid-binding Zn-ribbon protein
MHPDIEKLIRLQRAETELKKVESELAEIPTKKGALEADLLAERGRLDAVREALAGAQKARRAHEGALQDLETRRSRYKGQLMEVKTNKEYTAMLHEIEGVEREIRSREDEILSEMEKAENLTAEITTEEAAFKQAEVRHGSGVRGLDERGRVLEADAGRLRGDRAAVAATLDPDLLERFERVAKLRGAAVAEARDGMCQLCHVKLRLQLYAELKRNETIQECPSCSRILYYEPPVPVIVPEA